MGAQASCEHSGLAAMGAQASCEHCKQGKDVGETREPPHQLLQSSPLPVSDLELPAETEPRDGLANGDPALEEDESDKAQILLSFDALLRQLKTSWEAEITQSVLNEISDKALKVRSENDPVYSDGAAKLLDIIEVQSRVWEQERAKRLEWVEDMLQGLALFPVDGTLKLPEIQVSVSSREPDEAEIDESKFDDFQDEIRVETAVSLADESPAEEPDPESQVTQDSSDPFSSMAESEHSRAKQLAAKKVAVEEGPKASSHPEKKKDMSRTLRLKVGRVLRSGAFRSLLFVCLIWALIGTNTFILADVPDDIGVPVQDVLMSFITILFTVELLSSFFVDSYYRFSFYFWMDLIGTASMSFEVSFLLGAASSGNFVMLRTARTAKLGARIGRLMKLAKCISMLWKKEESHAGVEAKVLARRLSTNLSTKVSIIVIIMVLVLPLFSIPLYPTEDKSIIGWSQWLEESYRISVKDSSNPGAFDSAVDRMVDFYKNEGYRPFLIAGFGDDRRLGDRPNRVAADNLIEVEECLVSRPQCSSGEKASVSFDFTQPLQLEAGMEICIIAFICVLMVGMSFNLQYTVDVLLVQPMENMLQTIREYAWRICDKLLLQSDDFVGDIDSEEGLDLISSEEKSEIHMIQRILEKLAKIAGLKEEGVFDQFDNIDDNTKAVLAEIFQVDLASKFLIPLPLGHWSSIKEVPEWATNWELNTLEMSKEELRRYTTFMFFDSELGITEHFCSKDTFNHFMKEAEGHYSEVPYHCFAHAVDVLFTVFRLQTIMSSREWITEVETYALLISAFCHDLGHFGKTNPFLAETKHDLAMRYNDKSPLENMHCATLFDMTSHKRFDVFSKMTRDEQKEARKVCISTILHTDNVHHFDMVKDVGQCYELDSTVCDLQAASKELTEKYKENVLMSKHKPMWLQLFLHLADVSNPLKPWSVCEPWAHRVLDEFFDQGDEEKKLGIPVGLLNDREKVNRPGSQHGFINFLVAPLVTATVKVFPRYQELHDQMAKNLEEWCVVWAEDAKPSDEEHAKKQADVQKLKDVGMQLAARETTPPEEAVVPLARKSWRR